MFKLYIEFHKCKNQSVENVNINLVVGVPFSYPVVLKTFAINHGAGGQGKFNGGDGVLRELFFRKQQLLSVLTERRVLQPYGLLGNIFYVAHCFWSD